MYKYFILILLSGFLYAVDPVTTVQTHRITGIVGLWHFNMVDNTSPHIIPTVAGQLDGQCTMPNEAANHSYAKGFSTGVAAGKFGDGVDFDGSTSYVRFSSNAATSPTSEITVAIWVYFNSFAAGWGDLIAIKPHDWAGNNRSWLMVAQNNGQFRVDIAQTNDTQIGGEIGIQMVTGQWYYCVLVADGSKLKGYVNGVVGGTDYNYDGTLQTANPISKYIDMGGGPSLAIYSDAVFDEPAMWDIGLSAAKIISEYKSNPKSQ